MILKKFLELIHFRTKFKVYVAETYASSECEPSEFDKMGDFIVTGIRVEDGYLVVYIEHGDLYYNTKLKKWVKR